MEVLIGKSSINGSFSMGMLNPPAPKVLGRDRPDGTRKRLQVYLGGGAFFGQNLLFLIGRDARLQKHCKKQYGRHLFVNAPVQNRQAKSEKTPRFFQLVDLNFLVCNIFFCGSAGGLARRRIFEFLDPFSDWFSSFCDSRNTVFLQCFSVFCMLDG